MIGWIKEQFEWFKSMFLTDENHPNAPDHKHAISIGIFIVFAVAYLKKTAQSTELIDIPQGWILVLLAILGIATAKSAYNTFKNAKSKGDK